MRRLRKAFVATLLVATLLSTMLSANALAVRFLPLGQFGEDLVWSVAHDVSWDGSVVVGGGSDGIGSSRGFRWRLSPESVGIDVLNPVAGPASGNGVSSDGKVVVGEVRGAPFRWTVDEGLTTLADEGSAEAVSGDGNVVVGYGGPNGRGEAFVWSADQGLTEISGFPENAASRLAVAASQDGSIVAGVVYLNEPDGGSTGRGFRWTATKGPRLLEESNGFVRTVRTMTANGSMLFGQGYSIEDDDVQVRWLADGTIEGLEGRYPIDVSADASVRLYYELDGPTVWTKHDGSLLLRSILTDAGVDLTGWELTNPEAISGNGKVVVGYGTNPDGLREAWLADVSGAITVPEPPSLLNIALCITLLASRSRLFIQPQCQHPNGYKLRLRIW